MVFINSSDFIGLVIVGLTDITGSLFLALLWVLMFMLAIALGLGIPVVAISVIFLPLVLTVAAYTGDFLAVAGIVLIYAGFVVAENMFS